MRAGRVLSKVVLIVCGFAGMAGAHPGHGTTDPHSVTHYVVEPMHVAPLLVTLAVTAVVISLIGARQRRPR